ncbi:hypothetical protein HMPREF1394_00403 [Helicobacter pylori GAM105Ai]|uniref:dynamin family protein n=1 Tax=Helicobacter pylori TaxID=210 RepID=UPI0002B9FF6C|nr:dynamin family protein [Helicobacter pylori]EMG83740.1 hypothetical protein HMPREF1394_00403 [Helicobacter pylori GAM105Ai]
MNDPIASREERTKALLKDCDVVFIVSPSNQFLTDSDMSLFDRVSHKEGLQEIYFVASQADSAVLSMSEVEKSNQYFPTAFENAQKSLSSQLNNIMGALIEKYPNQREVFEKAIKNGVILASGVCFSMHKDFNNQASWERSQKTEEYHNALRNLKDSYPDAFSSDDKSKESLLFLSNMGTIEERLKKAAQEKEEIISQKLQNYAESQANNLHSLIAQLLQDLEEEKKRVKNADISAIKKQIEAYQKLSGNIEMKFREAYEEFILHFINNIRVGLEETLKKAIQKAKVGAEEEEEEERYTERVKQGGAWGSFKRNFLFWAAAAAGYEEVERTRAVIKAGAVLDYLTEMHESCERALNDSAHSFKIVFRKELYAKVFSQLREIISDDLIDEVAFKKSVDAVLDSIEFKEFDYADKLPGEIRGKTGFLKGDEANAFIQSVENHVRNFEAEAEKDVKGYIQGLREDLGEQDFANGVLSKLQQDMQNLHNQAQNKEQSIAQLDAKINALKGIPMINFLNGIFNNNGATENHHNTEGLKERYDLIARILNAKTSNEGLEEYQSILDNEFLEFASGVDSLKEKEIALLMLQEIQKELQLVASYPSLFQKTIVAVGGGFSAGKSTFLNNLLGLKLKLPEDMKPTTAIPTYCLKGKREVLMGFSQNGGMVELPNLAFNHKFLESLGFNLKEIMPSMLLSAPSAPFEFLCFIDTPGFNPANQGYTGGDKEASKESLKHAKHILWLVSCERGGIGSDDLESLKELYEEEGKQVFIVLSRADRRTKSQLEEVAKQIRETLKDHGIEFLGICAYSATRYQEYKEFSEKSHVFDSLEKFLKKLNQRSEKQNEILSVLYGVCLAYEKAIKQDASRFKHYQKALHSVKLDLMQKGFDDFSDATFNKIHSLNNEFSDQEKTKRENLARLNEVIGLFKDSIDKVFDRVSAFTWEKYKAENDDEEDDEANYREFEEIKKIVLYFRDFCMFRLDWYELSKKETKRYRKNVDYHNELFQLHYSLENLSRLREFKEKTDNNYQLSLNDEELQNDLREWRDLKNTPEEENYREFEEIKKMALYFREWCMFRLDWYDLSQEEIQQCRDWMDEDNELLQLDYSLKNLSILKGYKERNEKVYQKCLNNEELQNNLRGWRRSKQR